jgi:predicted ester cyclase
MDQSQYNAAVVRRLYEEALNGRNIALVDGLVAPHVKIVAQSSGQGSGNRDMLKQAFMAQWRGAPDHRWFVLDLIARADRVAVRLKSIFTGAAAVPNAPPAPRAVEGHEICFFRLANGLIEELWTLTDESLVAQQVGPTPVPIPRW